MKSRPIDYDRLRRATGCEKLFFYDSVDDAPRQGETDEHARSRIAKADAELDPIQATYGCHVREGTVTGREQRRRRQKQVDVLLAVEMLTHAFHKNFQSAILLAGDLDFKPVVDSLVSLGSFVEVWYVRKHGAEDLLAAADHRTELTLREFFTELTFDSYRESHRGRFPKETFPSPDYTFSWAQDPRKGRLDGRRCLFGRRAGEATHSFVVERFMPGGASLHATLHDPVKLEQYVSMVQGDVTWDP